MTDANPQIRKSPSRKSGVFVPLEPNLWQRARRVADLSLVVARGDGDVALQMERPFRFLGEAVPRPGDLLRLAQPAGVDARASIIFVARKRGRPDSPAIVSASRDGAFLTGILEYFKVQPVRGSSSRRGPQALLELTTWAERGYDLAITPDGPRGPRYVVQDGVISLAQLTGLPIVPVSYYVNWKIRVKSWDRFQIPLPFSLCEMICRQTHFRSARSHRRRTRKICGSNWKTRIAAAIHARLTIMIARVSLEIALRKEFDYLIPAELAGQVEVGTRVQVPFGARKIFGTVTALAEESAHANLKPILKVIGAQTLVTPKVLKLARWIGEYYCCAPETALKSVLPEAIRKEKEGWKKQLFVRALPFER